MRTITLLTPFLVTLTMLASCSSPPKPPSVDGTHRRPANSATAIELQVCKHDLQNTHLLAAESARHMDATAATLASIAARQRALSNLQPRERPPTQGNAVFTVRFDFGSTRVDIATDTAQVLIAEARSAPLVMLRGRTDGVADTLAESRIARERANAVRAFLVAAGINASRIRATYQPAGDHTADNDSSDGQALNRRVEIEIYRAAPVALIASN
ncbi:MAG: OmpA family protein [Comamonadaceae bacterium]|jgi:outer membrane protein OmpA-like peptidoglycan-associated protein|nr:OmpA family protein [Comamonadaceae bacterium]